MEREETCDPVTSDEWPRWPAVIHRLTVNRRRSLWKSRGATRSSNIPGPCHIMPTTTLNLVTHTSQDPKTPRADSWELRTRRAQLTPRQYGNISFKEYEATVRKLGLQITECSAEEWNTSMRLDEVDATRYETFIWHLDATFWKMTAMKNCSRCVFIWISGNPVIKKKFTFTGHSKF